MKFFFICINNFNFEKFKINITFNMKKLFTYLLVLTFLSYPLLSLSQDIEQEDTITLETVDSTAIVAEEVTQEEIETIEDIQVVEESQSFHYAIKEQFIQGGWQFMSIVLLCLILGLAVAIERIITLNLATTNTKKLLSDIEDAISSKGGVESAKEICKNTPGPVASIFVQGLMRASEGIEMVEKSIISYGSVEMGKLEKGMVWISLFISLAPMLGFMGTVIGMIGAFDAIAEAGDVSPSLVAGGIKIALLTTVGGLIVAVILQLFYNYLVSKIDALVNSMEDASITLVDILVKNKLSK
jgi:biopolymer transport protein ExbB